ncbi:MAG TPA: hypothetical protein VNL36_06480 [Bacteroidota bacterium]|nr:hypothetical protein [Bacteroidota bacterium]
MSQLEIDKLQQLLVILLEANKMERVKQWALHVAFQYALERYPNVNSTELWTTLKRIYTSNLRLSFPDQEEPGQSYRRASGDAFETYLIEYLNNIPFLEKAGIRALRLKGEAFSNFIRSLGFSPNDMREKDVDIFLQGITSKGNVKIFGAIFPKASYAERIRADEGASRKLMSKGLLSLTVTLDARDELGSEEAPSVKRRTINNGAFDACFSFNKETKEGGRIKVIDPRIKNPTANALIKTILEAWKEHK